MSTERSPQEQDARLEDLLERFQSEAISHGYGQDNTERLDAARTALRSHITGRAAVPSAALRRASDVLAWAENQTHCPYCGPATHRHHEIARSPRHLNVCPFNYLHAALAEAQRRYPASSADISEVSRHRAEGDHAEVATEGAAGAAAVRPADTREPDGWMNVEQAERLQTDRAITGTVHRVPPTGEQYVSVYFGTPAVQPVAVRPADGWSLVREARETLAKVAAVDHYDGDLTDAALGLAERIADYIAPKGTLARLLEFLRDEIYRAVSGDDGWYPEDVEAVDKAIAECGTPAVQPDAPLPPACTCGHHADEHHFTDPGPCLRCSCAHYTEAGGLLPDGAQPPRIEFTKEWCAEKATQEAGHEVGAGAVCSGGGDGTQRRWAVTEVDRRWEEGVPHDPRSEALYKAIARIDMAHNADRFGWKAGGDGDNGEELMYVLDIYYAELDAVAALERVQAAAPAQPSAQQEEEAPQ